MAVPHTEYQSEDEDSMIDYDGDQFPEVEDPTVDLGNNILRDVEDWMPRDPSDWEHYVPTWTRPGYDDQVEVSGDGSREKPRIGAPWGLMRPALLPTDPPASQYAQRFGIHPGGYLNGNSEARSILTPVLPNPAADLRPDASGFFPWEFEQSFQASCFEYFTTKELSDLGALDPNQAVRAPDSEGNLYFLFTRDKWTQQPLVRYTEARTRQDLDDNLSLNCWYNLNGEKKPWDVEHNDELWNALQPALQLASKILLSDHPFWMAILSIYHMRPVPEELDGRSQEQKADPRYRRYVSIWYDIDRTKMYPEARSLMDRRFDSTAATLEVLRRILRFSISRSDRQTNAETRVSYYNPENRSIRIIISAANIWPLLVPQYSISEKTSVSFFLARLILHELAHAARNALDCINLFPEVLLNPRWIPPEGTEFTETIKYGLENLGFDVYTMPPMEVFFQYRIGVSTLLARVRLVLGQDSNIHSQVLTVELTKATKSFQDVPQLEEGKSFETQLFGFDSLCAPGPSEGRHLDSFRPVILAVGWPWKHPSVHLHNQRAVDAGAYDQFTTGGYRTYLLDPPASAYNLETPLPVSSYAKFMQQSWWETDFVKFRHQALKIPTHSTDPSSPFKTIAKPSESILDFVPFLAPVIRSKLAFEFIFYYAIPALNDHQQKSILDYLVLLTRDSAATAIMRNRLHYEKRTWPNKLVGIQDLSNKSMHSFDVVWNVLNQTLQRPLSTNTATDIDGVVAQIRELLYNLMELNRLLGVQVQYSQAITAQYILKTPEARRKIHRRYMTFLRETLIHMRSAATTAAEYIAPSHEHDGELEWKTLTAPWEARFTYMVETSMVALDSAAQGRNNNQIDALANIRKYTQQTCTDLLTTSSHVENILAILGDQYIDFPIATAPTGLFPGVPIAIQMMELSKIFEKSAVREINRLKSPGLLRIIRQWLAILQTHTGFSDRVGDVLATERTRTEIGAAMNVIFLTKRRELQLSEPTHDGNQRRDMLVAAMRGQVMLLLGDDETLREWLREICLEEQDEEEFNTIMRMVYQRPAPQGPASQGSAAQ